MIDLVLFDTCDGEEVWINTKQITHIFSVPDGSEKALKVCLGGSVFITLWENDENLLKLGIS
tara:strand:- start:1075 stop:1260 length:186 start_codon:yes stop_codon:yes gene_type:complete